MRLGRVQTADGVVSGSYENGLLKTQTDVYEPDDDSTLLALSVPRRSTVSVEIISFGSPANPGISELGGEIEISYKGIGTLRNTVVDSTTYTKTK